MKTAQEETSAVNNAAQTAEQIWAQIDAEERGEAMPPAESTSTTEASTTDVRADGDQGRSGEQPDTTQAQQAAPAVSPEFAAVQRDLQQALTRLRNAEGQIGTLKSQLQQTQQVAQQVTNSGGEAPSAKQIADAQKNPEAMKRLKEDYPQFAEAMEAAIEERLRGIQAPQVQPGQFVTPQQVEEMRRDFEVELSHKGWKSTVKTPEFGEWMNRQPRERQMLAASESPEDAIRLLDLFKEESKKAQPTTPRHLEAAAALPGTRTSGIKPKAVEDMTPQEYWQHLDQLEKQQQKG